MADDAAAASTLITFREFFESVPPGRWADLKDAWQKKSGPHGPVFPADLPHLQLHCSTPECDGVRFFGAESSFYFGRGSWEQRFCTYYCKNCGKTRKTYALWTFLSEDEKSTRLFKFGEVPEFGPPTPARLITLIGPEREYFLKGRRAENQALGIAAFAYYRRVIESQKNRILDEIIRVSRKLSATNAILEDLATAKKENQFSKAVESIKHGLPQALLINGHNPLTLLHSALSEGLHAQTDDECLGIATSIRVVMADLAERLSQALKDDAELNKAVSRLLSKSTKGSDWGKGSA